MSKYIVSPCKNLCGRVKINGSKNAILPILCACLLTEEECVISEVPPLSDVINMLEIISSLGAKVEYNKESQVVKIKAESITKTSVDHELATKLRGSILVMGALIARRKKAKLPLPGGCKIGTRPVDLHLKGFNAMGVEIKQEHGFIIGSCKKLIGGHIYLDFPSVGATENIMIAAASAEGVTVIENGAIEPEIIDLGDFLNRMGASITYGSNGTIVIRGGKKLESVCHKVIADRIEAGTFLAATALIGGEVILENVEVEHIGSVISKLRESGVTITEEDTGLKIVSNGKINSFDIKTMPFPGFPTDLQSIFTSLDAVSKGRGIITETVFENRFMHVQELNRMGANIKTEGRVAIVEGVKKLTGAPVKATDLRSGAALIIAALSATGESEVGDIYHVERGYFELDKKLNSLGAKIVRVKE